MAEAELGVAGRRLAGDVNDVLDAHGDAVQRRAGALAGDLGLRFARPFRRLLGETRRAGHGRQGGVEGRVALGDPRQAGVEKLHGREAARGDQPRGLGERQVGRVHLRGSTPGSGMGGREARLRATTASASRTSSRWFSQARPSPAARASVSAVASFIARTVRQVAAQKKRVAAGGGSDPKELPARTPQVTEGRTCPGETGRCRGGHLPRPF